MPSCFDYTLLPTTMLSDKTYVLRDNIKDQKIGYFKGLLFKLFLKNTG